MGDDPLPVFRLTMVPGLMVTDMLTALARDRVGLPLDIVALRRSEA